MFAYVEWTETRQRKPEIQEVAGAHFLTVSIRKGPRTPAGILQRRCTAAARRLARLGITQAVFPREFPFLEAFAQQGVRPVDALPLCRRLAARLARGELHRREIPESRAMAAVCGDRLTPELIAAVRELCICCRYVMLDAPDGNGDFSRQMRREEGVALLGGTAPGTPEIRLLFSVRPPREGSLDLPLYPDAPLPTLMPHLSPEREKELPEDCERWQLLAALWRCGALRPGELEL